MATPFIPEDRDTTDPSLPDFREDEDTQPMVEILVAEEGEDDDDTEEITDKSGEFSEELMGKLGSRPMHPHLAEAIARRKEANPSEPAIMDIVPGPNLWDCLADYFDEPPSDLMGLMAGLIRMYKDLKNRGMDEARWAEIKGYLGKELLAVINVEHLGNDNFGLMKATTADEIAQEFQEQMEKVTSTNEFRCQVLRRAAKRHAAFDLERIIEKLFEVTVDQLIEHRYQNEIADWKKGRFLRRFQSDETARQQIDQQYQGGLDRFYRDQLRKRLELDLYDELITREGRGLPQKWRELRRTPIISDRLEGAIFEPFIDQAFDDDTLDVSIRNIHELLTAEYRPQELEKMKALFMELFEGEIAVRLAKADISSPLQNLSNLPEADRIFTLEIDKFKLFPN